MLVGLNVIDANLCMKGEDLDSQVGVIDFSMYLKDGGHSSKSAEGDGQITAILDQKNYVEELNRHLSASVNNLQAKVDALEKSNTKLTEEVSLQLLELELKVKEEVEVEVGLAVELAVANNRIITLQEDVERVKEESSYQLESRKSADASSKQKSDAIVRLEEKINQMSGTIKQLETRCKQAEGERALALEANRLFKQEFGDKIESLQTEAEGERALALEANRLFKQEFGDKIESLQTEVEMLRNH
ncbi:unnamed protein product, partial [Menidia menidia]